MDIKKVLTDEPKLKTEQGKKTNDDRGDEVSQSDDEPIIVGETNPKDQGSS